LNQAPVPTDSRATGEGARGGRLSRFALVPLPMVAVVFPTAAVIMGDSLMYIVLPARMAEFGVGETLGLGPAFWVALALSVNRFVRLASNAFAARLYRRLGFRVPFVGAVCLGALVTLSYGFGSGIAVLLAARALWGVAFSFLRLGAHLAAFEIGRPGTRGRLLGFYVALQRGGSLVAVTAGAALVDAFSRSVAFTGLAAVGIVGVLVATTAPALTVRREREEGVGDSGLREGECGAADITRAPVLEGRAQKRAIRRFWDLAVARLPEEERHLRWRMLSINLMRGATGFGANGLIISTMSPFVKDVLSRDGDVFGATVAVVTLAGMLVGVRWFSDLALSVPLGHLSDVLGRRVMILSGVGVMLSAATLIIVTDSAEMAVLAVPLLFVASSGVNVALDAAMVETAPDAVRAEAMSRYATWQDFGLAVGALAGLPTAVALGFNMTYLIAASCLGAGALAYLLGHRGRVFPIRPGASASYPS